MFRVLVASKSCGIHVNPVQRLEMFHSRDLAPIFVSLADGEKYFSKVDAVIIGMEQISAEVMDRMPRVRVIIKNGVGLENVDKEAAKKRGIAVLNLPGINADSVSEMAMGLMLSVSRQIARGDRLVRSGSWPRLLGRSICGKTLGIVGTGAIGSSLAEKVSGMRMNLLGYDIIENTRFKALGGKYVSLDTLIADSDIISIHIPLTPKTHHMFGKEQFEKMKDTAILINTSRGPVVDETALYHALITGQIFAAGLDVLESEPPEDSPLLQLDNVVLTPHIAGGTAESSVVFLETLLDKLSCALKESC